MAFTERIFTVALTEKVFAVDVTGRIFSMALAVRIFIVAFEIDLLTKILITRLKEREREIESKCLIRKGGP